MADMLYIPNEQDFKIIHNMTDEFKNDVKLGLEASQKRIPSKYLYDEYGSELFNKITRHPDYYLTNCELETLSLHKDSIAEIIGNTPFNLIELGPGEGIKTRVLVEKFLNDARTFTYIPIDISMHYLNVISDQFKQAMPLLSLTAIQSDFFKGLQWLSKNSARKNVVLFLGSSIGNFDSVTTHEFLKHVRDTLNDGDYFLLGLDLCKDLDILFHAYDDSDGITREFNLNLLRRINRELSGNFNLEKFRHYATYNVNINAMESYLISLEPQEVTIKTLQQSFFLREIEAIHMEFSHKYHLAEIEQLAHAAGFEVVENFTDSKQYFVDTLWRVNKNL